MIKSAHISEVNEQDFTEKVNKSLEKIQEVLHCKVIDIKYTVNENYFSALIIYDTSLNPE